MVQFDKILETPIMETCVLIPEDFSLKIDPSYPLGGILSPYSFLGNLIPSIINPSPLSGEHGTPENGRRPPSSLLESQVRVCSSKKLLPQTRYLPFSGTVRTDKLPLMPYLPTLDVRHRLGSYDEIVDRSGKRVRLCNWVRFVRYEDSLNQRVNMVATRNRGSVMFDVIREIPEGEELVVFLLPETNPDDTLSLSTLAILRTSLYRRTLDSIMAEAPLDLSRSLVSSKHEEEEDEIAKEATKVLQGGRNVEDKIASSSEGLERGPPDPPFKRVTSDPGGPNPFLSSPFGSPGSLLPNYFPFGFPPHPLFPPSPFSLSRMPSIVSEGLFSMNKSPPSGSALSKVSTPSSPSPSCKELLPLRLQSPAPKRRERTMLPCSECGKAFDRPSLLKRHMRTHTGEKPHVCDVCGKGFSTSSSLNTHRRIHSGEKPHQCGICGKRFTASSNLYYHKMTHVKEKPHKCSLCTRSFPTPGDLRSHMFVHNGQWPHKCAVCGKGFSKLTNLRNHTLLHSGDRQPKRNFSLEQMERSADAGTDLPPSSSSSLFSSLSPPSTSSSPLHLLSPQSSSLLPFPAPLSKRGRGEEKGEREEEMEEEDEEVGVIDDDDDEDFEVEVGNKSSEREIVETPEKKLPETSAVDGEGYKKSPTAPSEIVTEPAVNAEKHDEILDRQNVQRFSADDSTASTSSLHYCSTSPTGVEHLPEPSDHLPLRFHTSKPLQAFGFPEAETSNDPLPLTSKGDERRGAP